MVARYERDLSSNKVEGQHQYSMFSRSALAPIYTARTQTYTYMHTHTLCKHIHRQSESNKHMNKYIKDFAVTVGPSEMLTEGGA